MYKNMKPGDLKITDLRVADIDGLPKHMILLKIYTNTDIVGYGEVRDASSATYAKMLKSRLIGENPLNDSFEVHLSAESADSVRLDAFMAKAGGMRGVERATCPLPMIRRMHATVNKIRLVLLLFGGALLVISLILLSNTIRLAIFSKRYLINTMKLVGATKWFIMRPFLGSSLRQGILAGVIASLLFGVLKPMWS